jgi:hypothetical protein
LLFAVAVSLATVQCLFLIWGTLIGWSACCWLTPIWLAVAITVGAILNALALIVFALRRPVWGELAVGAAQVANVLLSLVASVAVSPGWLLLGAAPALAILILVVMLQRGRQGAPKRPSEI